MFTSIQIERIGNERLGHQPAWVKRVIDIQPHKLVEEYVDGYSDYSNANSVGSRGIYVNYLLQEGEIYHVSSPRNFKHSDTYFCKVAGEDIIRLEFNEVIKFLVLRKGKNYKIVDAGTGEVR